MIFRFFTHLVFVGVFLFGSTFSCIAFIDMATGHGYNSETLHSEIPDDCCPKDGHKKQIENKDAVQILQKNTLDTEPLLLKSNEASFVIDYQSNHLVSFYQGPMHDRQSLFFADTIRLLL